MPTLLRLLLSVATLLAATATMRWPVNLMLEWGKVPGGTTLPTLHGMRVGELLRQPVLLASASLLLGAAWVIWSKPFRLWRLWVAAVPILSFDAWHAWLMRPTSMFQVLLLVSAVLLALLAVGAWAIRSTPYRPYGLAFVATLMVYAVWLVPRVSFLMWLVATTLLVGVAWLLIWRTPYRRPFVAASLIGVVASLFSGILPLR